MALLTDIVSAQKFQESFLGRYSICQYESLLLADTPLFSNLCQFFMVSANSYCMIPCT